MTELSKKSRVTSMRVSHEGMNWLKQKASHNGRSVGMEVYFIIEEMMKKSSEERKNKKLMLKNRPQEYYPKPKQPKQQDE
jgi:hypothetical protein